MISLKKRSDIVKKRQYLISSYQKGTRHLFAVDIFLPLHKTTTDLIQYNRKQLLFATEAELFARCSLLVTFYSLLVARYFLLFACCSLLVTFCSLFFARCSLLFARYFLLVACYFLLVAFCSFAHCLLWNKVTVQISEIFVTFSGWWFSKFSQHAKPFSKSA